MTANYTPFGPLDFYFHAPSSRLPLHVTPFPTSLASFFDHCLSLTPSVLVTETLLLRCVRSYQPTPVFCGEKATSPYSNPACMLHGYLSFHHPLPPLLHPLLPGARGLRVSLLNTSGRPSRVDRTVSGISRSARRYNTTLFVW